MSKQTFFTFDQKNNLDLNSFFVNSTNNDAYKMINNITLKCISFKPKIKIKRKKNK